MLSELLEKLKNARTDMGEVLICHKCEQEFTWDDGNDFRGNIYICECCGEPICVSCMMENERYRREIFSNPDGISGLEKILCLDCFESKEEL